MVDQGKKFKPFGVADFPWRARCAMALTIRLFLWLRLNRRQKDNHPNDFVPHLLWEDRVVKGTFDVDVGGFSVHVVLDERYNGRWVNWDPKVVVVKYHDRSQETWEGDSLAALLAVTVHFRVLLPPKSLATWPVFLMSFLEMFYRLSV